MEVLLNHRKAQYIKMKIENNSKKLKDNDLFQQETLDYAVIKHEIYFWAV